MARKRAGDPPAAPASKRAPTKKEPSKKQESSPVVLQESPLFKLACRPFLFGMVQELDFSTFTTFRRTCRFVKQIIDNKKNLRIPFEKRCVRKTNKNGDVTIKQGKIELGIRMFGDKITVHRNRYEATKTYSDEDVEKLQKLPVTLKIPKATVASFWVNTNDLKNLSAFIKKFKNIFIREMEFLRNPTDWETLIALYKANQIDFLHFWNPIDTDVGELLLDERVCFSQPDLILRERTLLGAHSKTLILQNTKISVYTFQTLAERFIRGDGIVNWILGVEGDDYGEYKKRILEMFPGKPKWMPMQEIKKANMKENTLYRFNLRKNSVFVLLRDGTAGKIKFPSVQNTTIHFQVWNDYLKKTW